MIEQHLATGADITLLYHREKDIQAGDPYQRLTLDLDGDGLVRSMEYQSFTPSSDCVGLGACLIDKDLLVRLVEDACAEGHYNFITDVLNQAIHNYKVMGFEHNGYTARLTSVKSYFDVNMDMICSDTRNDLFSGKPVYTKVRDSIPVQFAATCDVANSIFGNGCNIRGKVRGSAIFRGVTIEDGADLERCVIMQGTHIGHGCHLRNVIIDKDCTIEDNTRLVATPDDPLVVAKGSVINGGTRG